MHKIVHRNQKKKKISAAVEAATVTRHSAQTTQHFINKNIIKGYSCTNVFCMHLVYMLGNSAISISFLRHSRSEMKTTTTTKIAIMAKKQFCFRFLACVFEADDVF